MQRVLTFMPSHRWTVYLLIVFCFACATTRRSAPIYLIRVSSSDTLAGLAAKYDTTWKRIAALNDLADGSEIKPGDILRVQPGPGGYEAGSNKKSTNRSSTADSSLRQGARGKRRGGIWSSPQDDERANDNAMFEDAARSRNEAESVPKQLKRSSGGLLFGDDEEARVNAGNPDYDDEASSDWLRWPVIGEVSSGFGRRGRGRHEGIDIRAKRGAPIAAAASGRVEYAGRQNGYGRIVIIAHQKYKTAYAHLDSIAVAADEWVDAGQEIGAVGVSGNASGPHLHFELRHPNGRNLDPMLLLPREELISGL